MRKSENRTRIPKTIMSNDPADREVVRKSGDRCKSNRTASKQKSSNNGHESLGRDSGMDNSTSTGTGDQMMMDNDPENVAMFDLASKVSMHNIPLTISHPKDV
jgi:hypothetical protein